MKRIFTMIVAAAAVCVAALALSSCKEDNLSPDPGQEGQQTFPDPLDHSDAMFQINWTPYKVEQGGDGVSIEVTSLSEKDFTFVCRPGSAVKAFKVAAFPLSELYNMLINLDWTGGITDAAVENALRSYIDETSSGGTTGYIGGADITYGVVGDDDNEMEFVWSQAGYTLIPTVVPDAEYIIIAQGYYEYDESTKEADTPAGLSLCYVRTPHKPLVGNPDLEIDIEPIYGGMRVGFTAADQSAAGFYEFTAPKSELMEYIDAFGETMLRDFVRHWQILDGPFSFAAGDSPYPMLMNIGEEAAKNAMCAAVAVDVNGTPGPLRMKDGDAKHIPEEAQTAEAKVIVDAEHIGSLIFWLNAEMSEYTREVDIRHIKKSEWDATYANDKEAREALKLELLDEGWVIQNPKFSYNDETLTATGEGSTEFAYRIDMKDILPNTEYVVAYVAVNYFGQADDVYASEPFITKSRNITDPDACAGEVTVKCDKPSSIGFTVNFTYNKKEVAAYYWQVVAPIGDGQGGAVPGYPLVDNKINWEATEHSDWMTYFFEKVDMFNNPLCNIWFFNPDDLKTEDNKNGTTVADENNPDVVTDKWTFADMAPGTTYQIVCAPEDWNGNVGEVKLYECTTTALDPGPNPEVQVTVQKATSGNGITVIFNPIKDVGRMLVMQATTSAELSATWSPADLVNGTGTIGTYTEEEIIGILEAAVIGDGTEGGTGGLSYYTEAQFVQTGSQPCVFLCVPIGAYEDGTALYGDLLYVIYDGKGGYSMDISDYLK